MTGLGPPRPRQGPDDGTVTVFVADEQDDQPVDAERWARLGEAVLTTEGVRGEAELSVLFVDEATIAGLNERFMGHTGPTDVLSFPLDGAPHPAGGDVVPGPRPPFEDDLPLLLGDVVICPAVAARNAPDHAGDYDDELALLLVHGILHVLGHDHATDAERAVMWARERELLTAHHGPLARDPWQASVSPEPP